MAEHWHRRLLEGRSGLFAVLTTLTISIGGLVEIVPMFTVGAGHADELPEPYTALEVAGRDIYVREGCMTCHSQMVRPFRDETLRYGEWSHAAEYSWDRPFLLGSRRIGPDLHRLGGKYPDAWHYEHMLDPRSTSPGSIMPSYPWLITDRIDVADVRASMVALWRVGTPYTDAQLASVGDDLQSQGQGIVDRMATTGIQTTWDAEIVALTAYLQRLGTDRPSNKVADASPAEGGQR
jgi:cytochrome c oxidase cbb3-type subunit I/II